ncbi:calcium-binding protein PBP1-like [Populus alba x Populus x berolinensis]|uniref:Calcium-binding protein PBP1-like n=1 Tax=Populus alba x Populus x berolinensis TaxID=444605 RepID=A0AAD6L9J0_9ROSI|nr:calcium-binding protein PBP1-like [Populus alba x Populus x berolinensis]
MANKLGGEGLIDELCNGFQLLMDKERGVITMESLKKNAAFLGLQDLSEDELRLSPELMQESRFWLEEALEEELKSYGF